MRYAFSRFVLCCFREMLAARMTTTSSLISHLHHYFHSRTHSSFAHRWIHRFIFHRSSGVEKKPRQYENQVCALLSLIQQQQQHQRESKGPHGVNCLVRATKERSSTPTTIHTHTEHSLSLPDSSLGLAETTSQRNKGAHKSRTTFVPTTTTQHYHHNAAATTP